MQVLPEAFALASFIGLWRSNDSSSSYKLYTCFSVTVMILFFVTQLLAMILSTSKSIDDFIDATYLLLSTFNACIKAAIVLLGRRRVIDLVELLLTNCCLPKNDKERKIATFFNKIARYNVLICLILAEITVTLVGVWPLLFITDETPLPIRAWHPYNANDGFGFWCTYLYQGIGLLLTAAYDVAIDTIATGLMIQACAQLDIMVCRLTTMTNDSAQSLAKLIAKETVRLTEQKIMKQSVIHHLLIFKFTDDINTTFGPVFTVQFCLSSVVLCMSIYKLTAGNSDGSEIFVFLYLTTMVVELFIYCYFGNEVTFKSLEFSRAISQMNWTSLHVKTVRELIIMMIRSTSPIVISYGPLIILSLTSFTSIIKVSYSAYNVLQ